MLDSLVKEEERVRSLLDSTAEGIVGLDLDGRCTFCNPAALTLLGYSRRDELQGRPLHDTVHHRTGDGPPSAKDVCRICTLPLASESAPVDDEVFQRPDGTSFPVEYRVHPVLRHGVSTGRVLTFTDATKRKQAEEDLRAAGELVERVFDSIHVCVAYLDRDLSFVRVNRAYAAAAGREPGEFVGKRHFELYPQPENEATFQRVIETGEAHSALARPFPFGDRPGRGPSCWDWRLEPLKEADGKVHGVILSLLDVTDRVRAEETRAQMAAIIESSADAIIGKGLDGTVRSWNNGAEMMYGYSAGEVVGRHVAMLAPPELAGEIVALTERLRRGESVSHFETVRVRKDGSRFDVSLTLSPIRDDAGRTTGISTIARDITERRRGEEAIRLLNAELEERVARRTADLEHANHELESFSYSVSHDLRAPLRAILGFSRILEEDHSALLGAEGVRLLGSIHASGVRMSSLIDDLLAFSRAGRSAVRRSRVDMEGLVRAVWNDLVTLDPVPPGRLILDPLPPADGDPALLRQVWTNLLSNALKFTAKREARVVEVRSSDVAGEVVYTVRDNGAGFDPRYAGKLFGVFQRVHAESDFEGTGIGLAIVQRIVERHGGRVWAEGAVDAGAAFSFTVPSTDGKPS